MNTEIRINDLEHELADVKREVTALRDWLQATQKREPQGISGGEVASVIESLDKLLAAPPRSDRLAPPNQPV